MRNNFKLCVFISLFFLVIFLPKLNAQQELPFSNPEATISMDLQDADLKDILKIFSVESGLNFIASGSVESRKMTLYFDKVPIKEAMDKLFKANNLTYELENDSNIFIVKDWGKPQIETVTRVFYLKQATVSSSSLSKEMASEMKSAGSSGGGKGEDAGITKVIKKLLTDKGSLVEDFRTNSLVVTDVPNRMPVIEQTIVYLDVPIPQIMLEVEMLDVSKSVVDKMGFEFGQTPLTAVITGTSGTLGFPFRSWAKAASSNYGSISINGTSSTSYQVQLDFLKTQTDTKYLARPRILTLNNETAEIKITTDEAVGEKKSTAGETGSTTTTTEAERYETGVSLRVTPQINTETGEITMFIVPRVAQAAASGITSSTGVKFYNPETRTTKSVVKIKDGETVIVGGLIHNQETIELKKLPILGDIPVVGALFRHVSKEPNKERELLIFITPHIMKESGIELARAGKIRLPEREQSTVSGHERQLAIGASLNNFEKK